MCLKTDTLRICTLKIYTLGYTSGQTSTSALLTLDAGLLAVAGTALCTAAS